MNYNYLLYFSELAQTEHYITAAARLGISQPALSNAIRSLENALGGVKLFEKVGRNIRLTEEGRFFQRAVDEALKSLYNATAVMHDSKLLAPVLIRVGMVSGMLDGTMAREIAEYTRKNPRVRFQLTEGSSEILKDLVRQEKLDMAIVDTSDRDRSLHFRKLFARDFYVALPSAHPLAERSFLEPADIASLPQVGFHHFSGESFRQWANGIYANASVVCTVNTSRTALDLVATGIGVAVIPKACMENRPDIRYVPLKNWHQMLYMCLLYDKWLEPPVWEFVELAVNALREKKKRTDEEPRRDE